MTNTTLTAAQKALGYRLARSARTCNAFSDPFRAAYGCTGMTRAFRYGIEMYGRRDVDYICAVCADVALADRNDPAGRKERLTAALAAAGIVEYRTSVTRRNADGTVSIVHPGVARTPHQSMSRLDRAGQIAYLAALLAEGDALIAARSPQGWDDLADRWHAAIEECSHADVKARALAAWRK